jgi:hypothetical protein
MRTLAFVLALGAGSAVARAKDPSKKAPPIPQQRMIFDDDEVRADLVSPDDGVVGVARHASRDRLIRVRQSFVPEMIQSCDAL